MKKAQNDLEELYTLYPKLKKSQAKQEVQKQPEQKVAQPAQPQVKKPDPTKQAGAPAKIPELVVNTEDDIEMEETVHDNDKMVAMSVIENEMEVMQALIKKSKGHEQEFYQDKLGSLEFSKSVSILRINQISRQNQTFRQEF